ncbi:C39 family peptidase [Bacillus horti]|uniref:Peptidase C39-like domain-containing protein n=1 Tax=Caldalkalibacillus horti TaxID=77523 RepID=A0ABT9W3W7_9BACI|nr:C39 family peptidase [Bacillus horti]MDQ0167950.1 hypothetical protein [Bacillus horti]
MNVRKGSKWLLVLLLSASLAFSASPVGADDFDLETNPILFASKQLKVTAYPQAWSNWCWVAAAKSVANFHTGNKSTQCQFYKWGKKSSSCPNNTGNWTNYQNIFKQLGFKSNGTEVSGSVTFSRIKTEINNSRPLILRRSWLNNNGKKTGTHHATPVIGYNDTNNMVTYIHISTTTSGTKSVKEKHSYMKSNSKYSWTLSRYGMYK